MISLIIYSSRNYIEQNSCCLVYCRRFNVLCQLLISFVQLKEYEIIGRALPSEKNPSPPLYRMRIFGPDEVVAKSKYWYFVAKLKKIKKSHGEVVSCKQVCVVLIKQLTPLQLHNFSDCLWESMSVTYNVPQVFFLESVYLHMWLNQGDKISTGLSNQLKQRNEDAIKNESLVYPSLCNKTWMCYEIIKQ